jgi:hypothetical protein
MAGTVSWNVTSYSLVDMNRCHGESFYIHCMLHISRSTILNVQYLIPTGCTRFGLLITAATCFGTSSWPVMSEYGAQRRS